MLPSTLYIRWPIQLHSLKLLRETVLFVCFVALRPMSTAMVIAGRSVHLTTLFSWAGLSKRLTSNCAHTFACNWQQPFLNKSAEGRRMTVEIISWSISTKVWYRAGIELATPGSAVRHASEARHVTDCATRPGKTVRWRCTYKKYIIWHFTLGSRSHKMLPSTLFGMWPIHPQKFELLRTTV